MATQEEINQFVEAIMPFFEQAPPPDDANEVSFPVVNQAVSADMWQSITSGFGTGVIDRGGNPYRLSAANDTTDSIDVLTDVQTGVNEAIIDGFYHRQTSRITLPVPPVASSTVYTIALQYDPLRVGLPIKLDCFAGTLDRSQGKKYLVLHKGTRAPSTVLSQVVWTKTRQTIVPKVLVGNTNELPDYRDGSLWGAEARLNSTDETWVFKGNESGGGWHNVSNPPMTTWNHDSWLVSGEYSWGTLPGYRRLPDGTWEIEGFFWRATGLNIPADSTTEPGHRIGRIPGLSLSRPTRQMGFDAAGRNVQVFIERDGYLYFRNERETPWISVDGVRFREN